MRPVTHALSRPSLRAAAAALVLLILAVVLACWPTRAGAESAPASLALTLADALELALGSDETLEQARQAVVGAEADLMGARSGKLPQLSVGATWTRNLKKPVMFVPPEMADLFGGATQIEFAQDWDLQGAVSLTWNLWTSGRLSAGRGAAKEMVTASRWQEQLVTDLVQYNTRAAYLAALLAQENARIATSARDFAAEALRVTQAFFDQGKASKFDLLRAQVELANRQSPLIQAKNELDLSLLTVKRICGLDPAASVTLADPLTEVPDPEPLSDLLAEMHAGSPELQAMRHTVAAGRQALGLAKAGRGPVFQLQGNYAVQAQWDDRLLPEGGEAVKVAQVALAFSMPIFDGFSAKADIGRARADLRTAEVELDRVTRDRELAVRQARLNYENALAALDGRQDSVALAEEAYRLAVVRLETGLASPLERLDAELALTTARGQLAAALFNCNIARAAQELAVGTSQTSAPTAEEVES